MNKLMKLASKGSSRHIQYIGLRLRLEIWQDICPTYIRRLSGDEMQFDRQICYQLARDQAECN